MTMNNITEIPDYKERLRALTPEKSFIIQAPAGSGKTSLLIQRYLVLLARVEKDPEEILAITFTRKAAAEMRQRIIKALQDATLPKPEDPHKSQTWKLAKAVLERDKKSHWHLLQTPNRLKIYTIDGLCSNLTRQMPLTSGCGAQPNIVDGVKAEQYYQQAVTDLLTDLEENYTHNQAVIDTLDHLDNNYQAFSTLLVNLLKKRDQWLPHISRQEDIITAIERIIAENIENCRNSLSTDSYQYLLKVIEQFFTPDNSLEFWQYVANTLLTKDMAWRKKILNSKNITYTKLQKAELTALIEHLTANTVFRNNLETITQTPSLNSIKKQQETIISFINTLIALTGHLKLVFQQNNAADYIEIALAALQALHNESNPSDLALKLDQKINHILVDEFQDTSVTQYKLLEYLTTGWEPNDGKTLFLVGDPMQSIYKFREAKVGLFLKAKHMGINNISLESLTLTTNFRSAPYLINWFNETFTEVMPKEEDIALGGIPFALSVAANNYSSTHTTSPQVEIHALPKDDYIGEAQQIVEIIKKDPNQEIAILVRNRSHLEQIIPALKQAQIPYLAVDLETLAQNQLIQDLLALTKAIENLDDRIAWLSIIRAPWCGLTLKEMHQIANQEPDKAIWDIIVKNNSSHLCGLIQIFKHALNYKNRKTLRNLIEQTWIALKGPNCVQNQHDLQNAKTFFELLETTESSEILEQQLQNLYAEPTVTTNKHSHSPIQIMTIHKSKGLEFDTVIVPGLNRTQKSDTKPLLLWNERLSTTDHTSDLIMAPINATGSTENPIYKYLQYEEKQKNHFETGRLLYVAVTRAKKSLHLLANIEDKINPGSLLAQMQNNFIPTRTHKITPIKTTENTIKNRLRKLREPTTKFTYIHPELIEEIPVYEPVTAPQIIGTIVHQHLQQLAEGHKFNLQTIANTAKNKLKQNGIFTDLEQHTNTITTAIINTLNDPTGKWILNPKHQDSKCEYQITTTYNHIPQTYIIDRTFIDNGIRWIIDYKTAIPTSNQTLQEFLQEQSAIYKPQLSNYTKIIQNIDNRTPIKTGLYLPLIPYWHIIDTSKS